MSPMTTPTREPLTPQELECLTGLMSPYELTLFNRAIAEAHAAGRDQGLREAAEVCRAQVDPEWPSDDVSLQALSCAAAIEQLRGK